MIKFRTETATAPAYWASYLINGDDSGIEDDERQAADDWIERLGFGCPVSCEPDSEFTVYHDAWNEYPFACETETYEFLIRMEETA